MTKCKLCNGKGFIYDYGDLHKSGGVIPCPLKYNKGWKGKVFCDDNNKEVKQ